MRGDSLVGGKSPRGGGIGISLVLQSRPILATSKDGDGPINESVYKPIVTSQTKGRGSLGNSNRPVKHFKRNTAHITGEASNYLQHQNNETSPSVKSNSNSVVDEDLPLEKEQIQVPESVVQT